MSGPQCCSNPPTLNPSSGAGHVEKLGGLDSYVTGAPNSKRAVVLVSDVYGYEAPNLRKLADKIADAGFFVAVPDFIHSDPFVPGDACRPITVWIKDHGTDKGFEEAKSVIEDLKSKGFSSVGAAGLCWGAKVVIELAKLNNFIQAGALLHPSFVTVDDVKVSYIHQHLRREKEREFNGVDGLKIFSEVKVPLAILGAENDQLSPPQLVKQFEKVLRAKPEIDYFVKIYLGVAHGWTVRYDVKDQAASKHADEAHQDLLGWFIKRVK